MNLATMESLVLRRLGLGSSDLAASELDRELNRIYRWEIPNLVGEASAKGQVSFVLSIGVDTYDLDAKTNGTLRAVGRPVLISTLTSPHYPIDVYDDADLFWRDFDLLDTAQRRPYAALVQGRTMTLRPVPDAAYVVTMAALLYRGALTSAGISDESEAYVCVDGAAARLASDLGMDEIAAKYMALFREGLGTLAAKYYGHRSAITAQAMEF